MKKFDLLKKDLFVKTSRAFFVTQRYSSFSLFQDGIYEKLVQIWDFERDIPEELRPFCTFDHDKSTLQIKCKWLERLDGGEELTIVEEIISVSAGQKLLYWTGTVEEHLESDVSFAYIGEDGYLDTWMYNRLDLNEELCFVQLCDRKYEKEVGSNCVLVPFEGKAHIKRFPAKAVLCTRLTDKDNCNNDDMYYVENTKEDQVWVLEKTNGESQLLSIDNCKSWYIADKDGNLKFKDNCPITLWEENANILWEEEAPKIWRNNN